MFLVLRNYIKPIDSNFDEITLLHGAFLRIIHGLYENILAENGSIAHLRGMACIILFPMTRLQKKF